MELRDVMSRDVEIIRPDATVQAAAKRMQERNIGSVLVGVGEEFSGILTERDIMVRVVAPGHDPTSTRVQEVMTSEILWCFEDTDLMTAANFMKDRHIRHLAVLNRDRHLVGIVSLSTLALHTGDETLIGTAIRWPA